MLRRTFVRAAIGLVGACAGAGIPALAHTPYRQWVVYRRKHLLIGCHRQDPQTYALARRMVAILEERLPAARARVARAPTPGRLASLLGTDQLDVALLGHADAKAMAAGRDRFAPYGEIALLTIFLHPKYALVGRADIPARHAWLIAHALHESDVDLPLPVDASPPLAWHEGARGFLAGQPLPDQAARIENPKAKTGSGSN